MYGPSYKLQDFHIDQEVEIWTSNILKSLVEDTSLTIHKETYAQGQSYGHKMPMKPRAYRICYKNSFLVGCGGAEGDLKGGIT